MDELLKTILDLVKETKDFALEQAPDIARQLVAYGFWTSTVYLILSLGVLGSALWAFRIAMNESKKSLSEQSDGVLLFGFTYGVCGGIFGAITATCCLDVVLKTSFAPKLYIIETLTSLIK